MAGRSAGWGAFPRFWLARIVCVVFAKLSVFFAVFRIVLGVEIFFVARPRGPCYIARASQILRLLPPSCITVCFGLSALEISGFSVFHSCGIRCEKPGGTGSDCALSSSQNRASAALVGQS